MATRSRAVDIGEARARTAVARLAAEARLARVAAGLSQRDVARALVMDRSQYSRIERGLSPHLTLRTASRICAVLGLDLSVRTFPAGDPIRDAAQIALLERLRTRCHGSLSWRTEVPLPIPGDRRAWDATITTSAWSAGIEAETALTDVQALDRRLGLKERDGGMDRVVLLLLDSRRNRATLRGGGDHLRLRFPVDSRTALAAFAVGQDPGGNALILL
jgi:transcriptional regulator with XRE-family HTH domain